MVIIGAAGLAIQASAKNPVRWSYNDVAHQDAEGLKAADGLILEQVYCDFHKGVQWAELRRRGLVRDKYKLSVDAHKIAIGMTEGEMKAARGGLTFCNNGFIGNIRLCGLYPASRTVAGGDVKVQWSDGEGGYAYTDNGIVIAIQQ